MINNEKTNEFQEQKNENGQIKEEIKENKEECK
jgi:hypothetical protein